MAGERITDAIDDVYGKEKAIVTPLGKLDKASEKFRNKRGSIVASAKSNIFEFPVFVSSSIPMEYATAGNSLLEQVYASYLQMAISIQPVVHHSLVDGGLPFAHLKSDTGRYIEYTDTEWQHDACHNEFIEENVHYEFDMITVPDSDNNAIMEYVNHQPLSEFEHFFTEGTRVTQKELREKGERLDKLTKEKRKSIDSLNRSKDQFDRSIGTINATNKMVQSFDERIKTLDEKIENANAAEKENLEKEKENLQKEMELAKANAEAKSRTANAPKFIGEKDIEKLNTLRPILMQVQINVKSDDGHLSPVNYIVGAKTFCRIIDADTIPEVAEYPLKEMNKVVRKAKWRAGELKFFSDIVFRIKQKKQTAVDSRNPKRKWYRRLYELAHMKGDAPTTDIVKGNSVIASFILDKMGRPRSANGVIPNCTLMISKTDVDICKMQTDIDLLDGKTAAKLCNELFLMGIVVMDVDQQSIKMLLPDLHNDYDVHSLASVNRQIAQLEINGQKGKALNAFI